MDDIQSIRYKLHLYSTLDSSCENNRSLNICLPFFEDRNSSFKLHWSGPPILFWPVNHHLHFSLSGCSWGREKSSESSCSLTLQFLLGKQGLYIVRLDSKALRIHWGAVSVCVENLRRWGVFRVDGRTEGGDNEMRAGSFYVTFSMLTICRL